MTWDPSVPATNAPLLSAPVRANFQALDPLMQGPGGTPFPLLAPNGTLEAPSYSFANDPRVGMLLASEPGSGAVAFGMIPATTWFSLWGTPTQMQFTGYLADTANFALSSSATELGVLAAAPRITLRPQSFVGGSPFSITVGPTAIGPGLELTDPTQPALAPKLGVGVQSGAYLPALATAPPTPPSGYVALYAKSDKKYYQKDDAGLEMPLATPFPLYAPAALDGGLATPGYSFASSHTTGLLQMGTVAGATTGLGLVLDGTLTVKVGPTATEFAKPILFGLAGTVALQTLSGALAQYLAGTPQTFRVHKDSVTYVEIEGAAGLKLPVLTAAPGTPLGGQSVLYQKTDKKPYWKDDTGVETVLIPDAATMTNPMTASGDLIYGAVSGAPTRLAKGGDTQVLTLVAGLPAWQAPVSGGMTNPMTAAGDLIYGAASGVATRLAKGADTQVLTLTAGLPTWQAPVSGGMTNPMTAVGDLIRGGASGAPTRLAAVALGQVLISQGVTTAPIWSTDPAIRNLLVQNGVIGTSGVGVIALGQATPPTTSPVDSFQLWTQDYGGAAGSASLYMRDERGGVIRHGTDASSNTQVEVIATDASHGVTMRAAATGSGFTSRSTESVYLGCNNFAKSIVLDQNANVSLFGAPLTGISNLMLGQSTAPASTLTACVALYVQNNAGEAGSSSLNVKDERNAVHTIGTHSVNGAGYRVINAASVQAKLVVTAAGGLIGMQSNHPLSFQTNNVTGMTLDTAGQLTVTRITASGDAGGIGLSVQKAPNSFVELAPPGGHQVQFFAGGTGSAYLGGGGILDATTGATVLYWDTADHLVINNPNPTLTFSKPASGQSVTIYGQTAGVLRWALVPGDGTAESGLNNGSNFGIFAYADSGAYLQAPFQIIRGDATNPLVIIAGGLTRAISIGAPDSGGAGFRMLRTVN